MRKAENRKKREAQGSRFEAPAVVTIGRDYGSAGRAPVVVNTGA